MTKFIDNVFGNNKKWNIRLFPFDTDGLKRLYSYSEGLLYSFPLSLSIPCFFRVVQEINGIIVTSAKLTTRPKLIQNEEPDGGSIGGFLFFSAVFHSSLTEFTFNRDRSLVRTRYPVKLGKP